MYYIAEVKLGKINGIVLTAAVFCLSLILYLLTLCRGIPFGDSAELALAAANLQIAHPPGYPLLTILGNLWSEIVFFVRPIVALNFLSALFASAASAVFFVTVRTLTIEDNRRNLVIAGLLALSFAASRTLWSTAMNFEVYSLSALLIVLINLCLLKYDDSEEPRYLYAAGYLFGLSLCNHLSTLALGPAFIIWALYHRRAIGVRGIMTTALASVLPLTLYAYLVVRSKFDLVLSWYRPQSWVGFKQQVLAETYQQFLAAPTVADIIPYLHRVTNQLSGELVIPFLFLGLAGCALQYMRRKMTALMLTSIIVTNLALNFSYTISDIAPYFLPSVVVLFYWIAQLVFWVAARSRVLSLISVAIAAVIAVVSITGNYNRSDLHDRGVVENYAHDLFARTPQGGTLFCGSDQSMFPALYLRYVENYRSDCLVSGHLPTLTHLRHELQVPAADRWTHFADLLNYAIATRPTSLVMAREIMNFNNDYPRIVDGLVVHDLVYTADSTLRIELRPFTFAADLPPDLYDPKEALLYALYSLVEGEEAARAGHPDADLYFRRAVQIVNSVSEPSLSSALAAYFADANQPRFVVSTIEPALRLNTLRKSERLQLLGGLGRAQQQMENAGAARQAFSNMLELDPANVEARFQMLAIEADLAAKQNQTSESISRYEEMLKIAPDQYQVLMPLSLQYVKAGNFGKARKLLQKCLEVGYRTEDAAAIIAEMDRLQK